MHKMKYVKYFEVRGDADNPRGLNAAKRKSFYEELEKGYAPIARETLAAAKEAVSSLKKLESAASKGDKLALKLESKFAPHDKTKYYSIFRLLQKYAGEAAREIEVRASMF